MCSQLLSILISTTIYLWVITLTASKELSILLLSCICDIGAKHCEHRLDNADILLDDKMRSYIAFDGANQYIIIGRNPSCLLLDQSDIYELHSETDSGKTKFTLEKSF